jgi:hypothetical protein
VCPRRASPQPRSPLPAQPLVFDRRRPRAARPAGLDFPYATGPGPARVRMSVESPPQKAVTVPPAPPPRPVAAERRGAQSRLRRAAPRRAAPRARGLRADAQGGGQRISNVVATIPGRHYGAEADRWVVLGNHRDAWVFGASDPNSVRARTGSRSRGRDARAPTRGAKKDPKVAQNVDQKVDPPGR